MPLLDGAPTLASDHHPAAAGRPSVARLRSASGSDIEPAALYALLRLRSEVFVVEQRCAYLDLDGRDLEPSTLHLWVESGDAEVLACLRVLRDDAGASIGRVVTRADARGRGHAGGLIRAALDRGGRPMTLRAQAHLAAWYRRFGFVPTGAVVIEDGIPHTPMRLG